MREISFVENENKDLKILIRKYLLAVENLKRKNQRHLLIIIGINSLKK